MTLSTRAAVAAAMISALVVASAGPGRAAGLDRTRYQTYPALEGLLVRQILVLGNNHTRELVIRREMLLTEDAPFRSADLWRDWEHIVDLGIFAEVEVEAVPSESGVLVVVSVYERPSWFVAPIADFDIREREITVGYRARLRNVGGLNRTVRSSARVGKVARFSASWETPWVGDRRETVALSLNAELPRPEIDELRTTSLSASTTRFLGDYRRSRLGLSMFARLEMLQRAGTHPDGPIKQLSPVVGAGLFRDTRDLRIDPSRGTVASAFGELISGWSTDDVSFVRSTLDGRAFLSLGYGFVLASRANGVFTTGDVPAYRKVGIGGQQSIRGQPIGVDVGNSLARGSMELRFPVLSRKKFTLPIPLVPKRISNVDLRIDGEIFVDSGSTWDDSVGFRNARLRTGAGVGLRIFLPIIEVSRFELSFDESGTTTLSLTEGNLI